MLTINVESTWGSPILDVISEMIAFSHKMNVWTSQEVNGVTILAHPDANPIDLHARYKQAADRSIKVVS